VRHLTATCRVLIQRCQQVRRVSLGPMATTDLWSMIHTQRTAVADMLSGLSPEQWDQPSLCGGWQVRDVAAHMIATGHTTPASFFSEFAASGFRFNTFSAKQIAQRRDHSPDQLVRELLETATLRKHPPGPPQTPLSEAVLHGEDIAKAVGRSQNVPDETLVTVADSYKKTQLLIGAKKRIEGLHLRGTDTGWETGDGPEVSGPTMSLLLAMAGRGRGLDDLTGEGVQLLAARMP
jgi:uncharacterized protein (TIGR03083 family)